MVVDWYYKVNRGSGDILHYVQWVDDNILFASENDPRYADGFYAHGKYPFVLDPLFEEKGSPAAFGYIDVMRSPQEYIDRMTGNIIDNATWAAKPRYFAKFVCISWTVAVLTSMRFTSFLLVWVRVRGRRLPFYPGGPGR